MASSLYNKISRIQQMKNSYITATNLRQGVNVFGVNGTYTTDATAVGNDLASGKTAYVKGSKITGGLRVYDATTRNIPWGTIRDDASNQCLRINYSNTVDLNTNPNYQVNCGNAAIYNGSYMEIPYTNLRKTLGIDALSIKKDVVIAGITGQYDASTEFSGIKMDPIIASDNAVSLTASITEVSGLDMTQGTNLYGYFSNLRGLRSLSNVAAPNVTNLYMFCYNAHNLQKVESVNFYSEEQQPVVCNYMFWNCYNLREIPNTVKFPKTIDTCWMMFANCYNIVNINSPLNISRTNIAYTFDNCHNLYHIEDIIIPNTDAYLNVQNLFSNCYNLDIANINFKGMNFNQQTYNMLYNTNHSSISNLQKFMSNVTYYKITDYGLAGTNIEYVSDNLFTQIPQLQNNNFYRAFRASRNLKVVNISNMNVISMLSAFEQCANLTDVSITSPNITFGGMTNIFTWCYNLTNVNVDLNHCITSMNNTFTYAYGLTNINTHNTFSINNPVALNMTFFQCTNLLSFKANMPMGVNYLYRTFYNCYNLTEVQFNSTDSNWFTTAASTLSEAFYNCVNLTSIDNKRDINIQVTGPISGIFYNCQSLNINSLTYNAGGSSVSLGGCSNLITNNPFIEYLDFHYEGLVANSYYGTNVNNIANGCSNLKFANINLIDHSTHTNYWYIMSILYNCSNLQTLRLNIHTNSNRYLGSYAPVTASKIDNYYFNMSRSLNSPNTTNMYITSCSINNLYAYFNCNNAYLYLSQVNINNTFNIQLDNVKELYGYYISNCYFGSETLNIYHPNINITKYFNMNYCPDIKNLQVNFCNAAIPTGSLDFMVNYCPNLETLNCNYSNITLVDDFDIGRCDNLKTINIDLSNLTNTGYRINILSLPNCTDINIYMPNVTRLNYTFQVTQCINVQNLSFKFGSKLNYINDLYFSNLYNLVNLDLDYANMQNINISYPIRFRNCFNLSDETIDNILGMCSKFNKTNRISNIFNNCNVTIERVQNLANYNNLISAGWTY